MKTSIKIKLANVLSSSLIFFLRKKKFVSTRNDIKWNLNITEAIDLAIFIFGRFEPSILNTIKMLSYKKSYDYIDIGANCGAHTMYLAQEFSKSRIFAIEPTNYSFNKLYKNVEANSNLKKRITIIQAFISSNKKKPKSVYSSWDLQSSKKKHQLHLGVRKNLKNCYLTTLDKIVKKYNIKNSVIKCDVDGNELYVFQSGINYLKKYKPKIVMELAPYLYRENNYNSTQLFKFFNQFGYKFFDVSSKKEISNIQDFSDAIPSGSSKNIFLI